MLYDENATDNKGKQFVVNFYLHDSTSAYFISRFDTSVGRGDFKTKIGVGQVIRGTH